MFGLDWFTIVVIGIFILLFWGIHERDKDVPYNPNGKSSTDFSLLYEIDSIADPAYMSLPGNIFNSFYENIRDTTSPLD